MPVVCLAVNTVSLSRGLVGDTTSGTLGLKLRRVVAVVC